MNFLRSISVDLVETRDSLFKNAFKEGNYPWYDSLADRVRPVWPVRISWLERLGKRVDGLIRSMWRYLESFRFGLPGGLSLAGNFIGTLLLVVALLAFFGCIFMLWLRRDRAWGHAQMTGAKPGDAARLRDIPDEFWPANSDPWAEANRRRTAGDLAGAIICLFAHQLLTLNQMGLIRLAPGRTGRHYVHSLRDPALIGCVRATLGLFEEVYYGRRSPTAEAFEAVWKHAQWFQERSRAAGTGVSP